ncbi:unnamed protein product [Parascedosporium putredinis]|uniref:Uncharacterized protein n=1 Tax=Parascedosporium putredinis TaxID=1442378 RepID=A0A9P1H4A1_9PEZI|nr:unnamed protein product [Parascedosporium putredinis]CAI7998063.1 unnamed protein product [Parascedosporium putredinis]
MMHSLPAGLCALALFTLLSPAHALPPRTIFARQSSCPADQVSCPSTVPDNFCCPSGHTCMALAGQTTIICCVEGKTCQQIEPISCTIDLQDAEKNLAKCVLDEDQSAAPPPRIKFNKGFPTTAVVVGVLVGVLVLVSAIVFLLIWRSKRRKQPSEDKTSHARNSKASSSFGNYISEPIVTHGAFRTDFIRKPETSFLAGSDRLSRMFNRHRNSDMVSPISPSDSPTLRGSSDTLHAGAVAPLGSTVAIPPIRTMSNARRTPRPVTPRLQREPSSESINIFAAPGTVERGNGRPLTQGTTFTEMMDQADLGPIHKGRGFVPSPLKPGSGENASKPRYRW